MNWFSWCHMSQTGAWPGFNLRGDETPKASSSRCQWRQKGWGAERGCLLPRREWGMGSGLCPLPIIFFDIKMVGFCAFWWYYLPFRCLMTLHVRYTAGLFRGQFFFIPKGGHSPMSPSPYAPVQRRVNQRRLLTTVSGVTCKRSWRDVF